MTLVITRLEAAVSQVADLARLSRLRWPVETSLAQLKTTMPMAVLHGQTVPGMLQDLTVFAIVDTMLRLVMRPLATRHLGEASAS
jgi:hypothetical protein